MKEVVGGDVVERGWKKRDAGKETSERDAQKAQFGGGNQPHIIGHMIGADRRARCLEEFHCFSLAISNFTSPQGCHLVTVCPSNITSLYSCQHIDRLPTALALLFFIISSQLTLSDSPYLSNPITKLSTHTNPSIRSSWPTLRWQTLDSPAPRRRSLPRPQKDLPLALTAARRKSSK
jgi:hypothetical protein